MSRLRLIAFRLMQLFPVLVGISIISFIFLKLTPGDPVRFLVGDRASDAVVAAVRAHYGLDRPALLQYVTYLGNVLHGDLGWSIRFRVPVRDLILDHLSPSLFLAGYVMVLTIAPTLFLGILAARNQGRLLDQVILMAGVCGLTVPVFWLAIMLVRLFGVDLGWFPVSGYGDSFWGHVHHLFLPAVSTALWLVPVLVRNLRAAIIDQMVADYVVASRSKGLPEGYIFRRHILMNALLPTLHLFGVLVAFLIGGTVVVETVYAIPGLGQLMISSILARDYFVVQGLTLFFAACTVLVTLAIDVLSALIDRRIAA